MRNAYHLRDIMPLSSILPQISTFRVTLILLTLLIPACSQTPWNNPYPAEEKGENILYSSFSLRPNHLDPAQSYSSNEYAIIAQVYEPPLQYHYLKRPYTLIPLTAAEMPEPVYLDAAGNRLPKTAPIEEIALSVYEIHIRAGIYYQPHPAFARDEKGRPRYQAMGLQDLKDIYTLSDFPDSGTRELTADDYVYQIKRLAHPKLHSPIFGLMSEYIVGLREYAATLAEAHAERSKDRGKGVYLDLGLYPLEGAEVIGRYIYQIKVRGKYPQFLYWLAMPFFSPIPHEADRFYSQPGMLEKNLTFDWYPVGTGPFMLTVNNPNRQMVLMRNPNFHLELYPEEGEPEDEALGLLRDAGKPLPFIGKAVYSLEKETIPYWNKFLQGYYDTSGISSDSFDQAIQITGQGDVALTEPMQAKGIRLLTAVRASMFYMGFNMLDPVVGGQSEKARKVRQAISIAVDYEEYISIFLNGRGIPAQGPIPPGIFGHVEGRAGINPYVYEWVNGGPRRKPIEEARRLLAQAGYPNGRDAETGKPLLLYFDTTASGPDDKARLDWFRKQFQKLDLQLVIRNTDYNRFQEKMLTGSAQIFQWGWNADYPDPENFLFLLHGPNSKVGKNGENSANYDSPEFNRLFDRMKNMESGPERMEIILEMVGISRRDAPWLWGFHPKSFGLQHDWLHNSKPFLMGNNSLKYKRIEPNLRSQRRSEWNHPVLWPVVLVFAVMVLGAVPAVVVYRRKERQVHR